MAIPPYFNFAAKAYPSERKIARAKAAAVGGKRKRCTKGKNCSAACIAAHMVCLVDLPWVGAELTKAKAQIQAAKKNTPAGAPAPVAKPAAAPKPATPAPAAQPAAKPAPQPVAAPQPAMPTPTAKPAAASQPATPQPAAKPKKKAIDKIPTVEGYKKWGIASLESLLNDSVPNFNPNAATTKKVVANATEALKQLKAEQAAKAAAAKPKALPLPTPSAQPTPKPATPAPAAKPAPQPAAQSAAKPTPQAAPAPAPKPATPAPAAQPTAKPAPASAPSSAQLPVKAGSKPLDPNKYDSGNFGQFHKDAQSMGLTKKETDDFLNKWLKDNSMSGLQSKDMPAFIKDFNKAAGLQAPVPAAAKGAAQLPVKPGSKALDPAKYDPKTFTQFYQDAKKLGLTDDQAKDFFFDWLGAKGLMSLGAKDIPEFIKDFNKAAGLQTLAPPLTKATSSPAAQAFQKLQAQQTAQAAASKPAPLMKNATGDMPQPASPSNPHGLSLNQQAVWKKAFEPITSQWYKDYGNTSVLTENTLKHQGKGDEARIARLLRAAQDNKFTQGLKKFYDQVKTTDKSSFLTDDQLAKMPTPIRNLVQEFGQAKLKKMLLAVNGFTGLDYGPIRNAYRGRPPQRGDEKILTPAELQKKIDKYKKKGDLIQEFLMASQNRPSVPKFRGVPMDDAKLNEMINHAKTGGSFREEAMNSWSTKNLTAENFTHPKGGAKNRVMFRTVNKLGSSVKSLSNHAHENELLTPAGARYKVVGHTVEKISSPGNPTVHFFDVVEY
jgi:hypothetical protein